MTFRPVGRVTRHFRRAKGITRRYFITNGFDGALTMLGLMVGFYASGNVVLPVAISACLGGAVALFMSGLSSAYLSEIAERKRDLRELEQAMITDLKESEHGQSSRFVPILVALVNGLSPLLISLIIITPLWLQVAGVMLPVSPIILAISIALITIFLLGVFLGRVSKTFWLWSGLRALAIAIVTMMIILFFGGEFSNHVPQL
ncbi:MAG: hypothetical protein U9Q71_10185 [Pseudomonadota bacterium]|nr:hypothetical protein [Pseudomonadota bacterium]